MKVKPPAARLRCAIYTRKSSDEGLEQSFNSLDAQREACEAYVMSQAHEGWSALPAHYDDGGFSGGSMERPGLRQLLADIALRKVDVVVVYKVDRLTRSLADFAKIVEIFDGHGVSFVSVTQAFNTTSSMGRLTLNVLLSFAQFEREVTGERIRDKIAASKKKGMWMGGVAPFGYKPHERTLLIDEVEAATVRHIFTRYIALGSVHALKDELKNSGIRSRPSKRTDDTGGAFVRGQLYHLLANRVYVGEIVHKDECYPGQHPALIDRETFEAASKMLAANRRERQDRNVTVDRSPLTGLIFDVDGKPLCPVSARNNRGRLYRYYVSAQLQQGGRRVGSDGLRVPAPALETLIFDRLSRISPAVTDWLGARRQLVRVEIDETAIIATVRPIGRPALRNIDAPDFAERLDNGDVRITIASELRRWAGRTEILRPDRRRAVATCQIDRSLIRGLGRSHSLVAAAKSSRDCTVEELAQEQGAARSYIRRLSRLAFLAPDIQQAIIEGQQPVGVTLERLMRIDLPMSWTDQRRMLGF